MYRLKAFRVQRSALSVPRSALSFQRSELLYLRFQKLACKMYTTFNRSQRFLQHICNFMILITIKIKQERISEYFRQTMYGSLNIADTQIAFCITCYYGRLTV